MNRKKEPEYIHPLSDEALSRFWYCPKDKTSLQLNNNRWSTTPYFTISRDNIKTGISNAIALRKINPESEDQTYELVVHMFNADGSLEQVELVGVVCAICGSVGSAPKVGKVMNGGVNVGRALYRTQMALETKNYGRFRFVDHFGLGRYNQRQDGQQGGSRRSIWFWGWILGFRTIILVFLLYYILGLEMKLGRKWLPLGPILLILAILASIFAAFMIPEIRNTITNLIRGIGFW